MELESKAELLRDLEDFFDLAVCGADAFDWPLNDPIFIWALMADVEAERYPTGKGWNYVPKSANWAHEILFAYEGNRFKRTIRMSRESFSKLVRMVEKAPEFINKSTCKQKPVHEQVLIALYRLGHSGTSSGPLKMAQKFGVSEGHVVNCTRRFTQAMCDLSKDFVIWPSEQEKANESNTNDERAGFAGCIGKIDGTMIILDSRPCKQIIFILYM